MADSDNLAGLLDRLSKDYINSLDKAMADLKEKATLIIDQWKKVALEAIQERQRLTEENRKLTSEVEGLRKDLSSKPAFGIEKNYGPISTVEINNNRGDSAPPTSKVNELEPEPKK